MSNTIAYVDNQTLTNIADAIRDKTGTSEKMLLSDIPDKIRNIEGIVPTGTQTITENGEYDVLNDKSVMIDVQPDLRPLSVSENGSYEPDDFDGYSDVTVDVEPNLETLSVTENGLYLPESGTDGFDRVNVDVPTGGEIEWDGVIYPVTDESDKYYADHVFNTKYIWNLYAGDTVIIEALGRGILFSFRGGQPTSGYLQEYAIGGRTNGNILVRFTLNITENTSKFILGGYQWSADDSHSGYDYYCGYGEYIKWKVIH